jgi:hypothetical protein
MGKVMRAVVGSLVATTSALASTPAPPRDYAVTSKDAKFVLVMLVPDEWKGDWPGKRDSELRKKYRSSGLYDVGRPGQLLWAFAYVWGIGQLVLASDGVHLMQVHNPGHGRGDGIALSFFSKGRLLKQYGLREIIPDKRVRDTAVCPVGYCWWRVADIDDAVGRAHVTSVAGNHVFDLRTGEYLTVPGRR